MFHILLDYMTFVCYCEKKKTTKAYGLGCLAFIDKLIGSKERYEVSDISPDKRAIISRHKFAVI